MQGTGGLDTPRNNHDAFTQITAGRCGEVAWKRTLTELRFPVKTDVGKRSEIYTVILLVICPAMTIDTQVELPPVKMNERLRGGVCFTVVTRRLLLLCLGVQEEATLTHLEIRSVLLTIPMRGITLGTGCAPVVEDLLMRVLNIEPARFARIIQTSVHSQPLFQFIVCSTCIAHRRTLRGRRLGCTGAPPKRDCQLVHGKSSECWVLQIRFW